MFERTFSFWRRWVGKPSEAPRKNEERRLWVRYPADLTAIVQPTANGSSTRLSSRVRDISRGGVNLLVEHEFQAGELISVELPLGDQNETQLVLACIVRVNEEAPGRWALGCVFSHELADEDLHGLGGKRVKAAPSDQRTWMRFQTKIHAQFQKVGDPASTTHEAMVLNVSASGVGLQTQERIEPGVLLSVDLLDNENAVRQTMLACVVHVSRAEGESAASTWALGCNFIRSLSEEDLKGLL